MDKKLVVLKAPVTTRSGYGSRSRDIAHALIDSGLYDVRISPTPWGMTPTNALNPNSEKDRKILDRLTNQVERQPDVFIQITIPNEFERLGKINIGITAGIETTACQPDWLVGCNKMDLVLASSNHSAEVFRQTRYDHQPQPNAPVQVLQLNRQVDVLFEGLDPNTFKKIASEHIPETIKSKLDSIPEEFCFLFVGHWLEGNMGQDRKDIGMLVHVFLDAFKNKPPSTRPALILKTSGATFSKMDELDITRKLKSIFAQYQGKRPNVYLIHGDLTDEEMNGLYNHRKVKSMVSFAKGEGFGRPLLEFSLTGKPTISSAWSGPMDFLHPEHTILLPGQLTKVDPSAANNWISKDSSWFTVDYPQAAAIMNDVFKHYELYEKRCKGQVRFAKEFSLENMQKKLVDYIENLYNSRGVPQKTNQNQIVNLPKLIKK